MYGRGVASIAEQINGTIEEAQKIVNDFYKSFPKVKAWMDASEEFAKKNGYVEDLWGRRRRLPDILLPKYEIKDINSTSNANFNPFIGCQNRQTESKLVDMYRKKLENIKGRKQYEQIQAEALTKGIEIHDNSGFVSQAQRQCVNARIQGSAATMTKKAMNKIYADQELKDLGFRLCIGVHDELIGECPKENVDKVAELLTYDMKTCAEDSVKVPFKCDADISEHWYDNDYNAGIISEFNKLCKNMSKEEALQVIYEDHIESLEEDLNEILKDCIN